VSIELAYLGLFFTTCILLGIACFKEKPKSVPNKPILEDVTRQGEIIIPWDVYCKTLPTAKPYKCKYKRRSTQ